jgi:AraC family transcriptional regulator
MSRGGFLRLSGYERGLPSRAISAEAALDPVLERIESQLERPIRIEELAQLAGLSVSAFARAFKNTMGIAPLQYLTQRRIERARGLLETTTLRIIAVAAAVGYEDPGHFAMVFRRHVGLTPSEYRRRALCP